MAQRRIGKEYVAATSINVLLAAIIVFLGFSLFTRLLIFDEAGNINYTASVPAFGTLLSVTIFGIIGLLFYHGWLLLMFTLTSWAATTLYEPVPLQAGINYVMIVLVLTFSSTANSMIHLSRHIRPGPVETVSKHFNQAFLRTLKNGLGSVALAATLTTIGAFLLQQEALSLNVSSLLAVLFFTIIALIFILARSSLSR